MSTPAVDEFYNIHHSSKKNEVDKDQIYTDQLDELRERNFELHSVLEKMKFSSLQKAYKRNITVVDRRRMELVWFFWPAVPWSLYWHLGCRGAEYTLFYIWILRDWAWAQSEFIVGYFFGSLAIAGAVVLFMQAIFERNLKESVHSASRFFWLLGTYLWFCGTAANEKMETHEISTSYRVMSGKVLIFALFLEGVHIFIIRPWVKAPAKTVLKYSDPLPLELRSVTNYDEPRLRFQTNRFKCSQLLLFEVWRDWENVQLFFWIGKDIGASYHFKEMWIIFYIGAMALPLYMLNTSLHTRRVLIDHLHYMALVIWLTGVFIYQMGFMFFNGKWTYNHQSYFYPADHDAAAQVACTHYGAMTMLFAFVPLGCLYAIWILATFMNVITDDTHELVFMEKYEEDVRAEMGPQERQFFEDSKSASLRSQEVVEETKTEKETLSSGDRGAKVVKKVQRHKKNKQPNLNIFEDDNDDDLEITPIDLELSWMEVNRSEKFSPV